MDFNNKFPVLSTIAKIIFFVGCIILIIGICCGGYELIEYFKLLSTEGGEWYWSKDDIARVIAFVVATVLGLITMAIAEVIGVLFTIEKNTRQENN